MDELIYPDLSYKIVGVLFGVKASFIPITVAVAKWVEANGFGGNYFYIVANRLKIV